MITLNFHFESVDEAMDFLRAVNGPKTTEQVVTLPLPAATGPEKKERKPRSDAGQPRGPYKRKESEAEAAAPATQTPADTPPAAPEAAAPAAPKQTAQLTIADVRAAMTGRSTEKNIGLLRKFGYDKSSSLPPEQYAAFIAACQRGE